jgi:hypothetical protein
MLGDTIVPSTDHLQVWQGMNSVVAAIREQEAASGFPTHLVTVQGTRAWGRTLDYYLTHPITAGGGKNVVYETHACEEDRTCAGRREKNAAVAGTAAR